MLDFTAPMQQGEWQQQSGFVGMHNGPLRNLRTIVSVGIGPKLIPRCTSTPAYSQNAMHHPKDLLGFIRWEAMSNWLGA